MSVCDDREEVLEKASRIAESISNSRGSRTAILVNEKVTASDLSGQAAFWMRRSDLLDRGIIHLIRSHVLSCESLYPGSGEICLDSAVMGLSLWRQRERSGVRWEDVCSSFISSIDLISQSRFERRRLQVEDLDEMLNRVPVSIRKELTDLIRSSPLGATVSVKKGSGVRSSISLKTGCSVKVSPEARHLACPPVFDPVVVLFDGVIESVAQIHRVLSDSAESGKHYVIGCRGFSPDVLNTIKVNLQRGTIRVLALTSRIDDLTVGALDDIAAYTGSWVINSQSGESISTAFDRLVQTQGKFWIESDTFRSSSQPSQSLISHVETLKRDAALGDQSVSDFLNPRILGLSSSRVEVHLGSSDLSSSPTALEMIDSDMRSVVSSFTRGVSRKIEFPSGVDPQIREIARQAAGERLRSAGSAVAGVVSGIRFAQHINSIGHAVTL